MTFWVTRSKTNQKVFYAFTTDLKSSLFWSGYLSEVAKHYWAIHTLYAMYFPEVRYTSFTQINL